MKKVYLDELEDKSTELINYSKNDIKQKIEELKELTQSFIWQGPSHDSYILGYNKEISELEKFNDGLTKIASFLVTAKDGYSEANKKIDNAYEELLTESKRSDH